MLHPAPTAERTPASSAASLPEAGLAVRTRYSVAHLAMDTGLELWIQDPHLEAQVAVVGGMHEPKALTPLGDMPAGAWAAPGRRAGGRALQLRMVQPPGPQEGQIGGPQGLQAALRTNGPLCSLSLWTGICGQLCGGAVCSQ